MGHGELKSNIACLESYDEFQTLRPAWEMFTRCWCPENYGRSHAWLSAWWKTYHHQRAALVYFQHDAAGEILAAAPLMTRREVFGGFPVLSLMALGTGLGRDDFMLSPKSSGFVEEVIADLVRKRRWDVARFSRINCGAEIDHVRNVFSESRCTAMVSDAEDFFVDLPDSYDAYLRSRSGNFRSKMNQACKRLEGKGKIDFEVLDPYRQTERVMELGLAVARASWQFQEGTSHFNVKGRECFYANLFKSSNGGNGEDFFVLTVFGKPVGFVFGCRSGSTYYLVDTAYNAEYSEFKIGRILFGKVIEHLIRNGMVRFDLEGGGEYKNHFANGVRKSLSLEIYNHSLYAKGIKCIRRSKCYNNIKSALKGQKNNQGIYENGH